VSRLALLLSIALIASCALDARIPAAQAGVAPIGVIDARSAVVWTSRNIFYEDTQYYLKQPSETYFSRLGDCADTSILAMYIINQATGERPILVIGISSQTHAWIKSGGVDYEPQLGYEYPEGRIIYPEIVEIDYTSAMLMAGGPIHGIAR